MLLFTCQLFEETELIICWKIQQMIKANVELGIEFIQHVSEQG